MCVCGGGGGSICVSLCVRACFIVNMMTCLKINCLPSVKCFPIRPVHTFLTFWTFQRTEKSRTLSSEGIVTQFCCSPTLHNDDDRSAICRQLHTGNTATVQHFLVRALLCKVLQSFQKWQICDGAHVVAVQDHRDKVLQDNQWWLIVGHAEDVYCFTDLPWHIPDSETCWGCILLHRFTLTHALGCILLHRFTLTLDW